MQNTRDTKVFFGLPIFSIWWILLFGTVLVLSYIFVPWFLLLSFLAVLVIVFALHLDWGLYVLAGLSFFLGWEINFSLYSWAKEYPVLPYINAPLVDLFAVVILISLFLAWVFRIVRVEKKDLKGLMWVVLLYSLFIISSFVSLSGVYEQHYFGASLKYLLRPMVFVFLAYLFFPYLVTFKKEILLKALRVWLWVGGAIAFFGLSSLLVVEQGIWWRVVPYGIRGFAPLGYNHNLLAEALIPIIPIALYFFLVSKKKGDMSRLYCWITVILFASALLTLSRAAWVALAAQLVVGLVLLGRKKIAEFMKGRVIWLTSITVVSLVVFGYMVSFLGSSTVASSTQSRLETTKTVAYYVGRSPLWGYGPGMYVRVLGDTFVHVLEYGEPLDAHGLLQKLVLEEGLVGSLLFIVFLIVIFSHLYSAQKRSEGDTKLFYQMMLLTALGAVVFQLFNTSYFHGVMWMPLGIALASTKFIQKDI